MKYIQRDLNNPEILKIEERTLPDKNTVCSAPENAESIDDLDIIDDIDELTQEIRGKKAVINETKKADKASRIATEKTERESKLQAERDEQARLKAIDWSKASIEQLREFAVYYFKQGR